MGILLSIDVIIDANTFFMDMVDVNNDGLVDMAELLITLMKLRGEVSKMDMVASWALTRATHTRLSELEHILLSSQQKMQDNQDKLAENQGKILEGNRMLQNVHLPVQSASRLDASGANGAGPDLDGGVLV